jgi:hypothetical protein
MLLRSRLSLLSVDAHTAQGQAIIGTPVLVPVPKKVIFNGGLFISFTHLMGHCDYVVVNLFYFWTQHLGIDAQLGDDIDQCADATFQLEEFIQHHHLSLLQNTVAALKITSFVAYDVFGFIQYSLDLIESRLCELHHGLQN